MDLMKKAGIITHYNVHNHGAHLQLYALSKTLQELGYDAKALQFSKNYDFMGGPEIAKKYNVSIRSIPLYLRYLKKNGLKRTLYNVKKRKLLAAFRVQKQLVGEYYSKARDLDAVVIGSDEIFSIEAGPNPWYYGIGVPCKKQISYAASFGPTTVSMVEEHNVGGMIAAGLQGLRAISVRDGNSAEIVKSLVGDEPAIVCDPVLLYDFSNEISEEKMAGFRKAHPEKYCIVYAYDDHLNEDGNVQAIRAYARKQDWKVYSVAYFHKWCDKNVQVAPLDAFQWFRGAEAVFTDTFHGTVLSLVTGTQFVSKVSGNGNKLDFLLRQYGVAEREADGFERLEEIMGAPIDYEAVGNRIAEIRGESMEFLRNALKSLT